ncbi:hypothetical protein [Pseudomonas sp. CGJS7]|uniref:hypothetical protein n=1 Tax=Pseudomonas sp. CGJS7 TaxID=3109348 RepID=UPI00300BCE6A
MTNAVNPGAGGGTAGLVSTFIADVNKSNNIGNGKNAQAGSSSSGGGVSAGGGGGGGGSGWFAAMARAWGATLDGQAARITELSGSIGGGNDSPSSMIALTSESLRMQFISNNASTSQNAVADALKTLAQKN